MRHTDIEEALASVNRTKCEELLSESEVAQIARSVDKSNKLIGEPSDSYTGQHGRSSSEPKSRIVYAVSTSDTPTLVADLLQKEVSLYPRCTANTPNTTATIGEVLEVFRIGGKFLTLIEAVRSETDKEKRNKLKKETLPCVVPGSEPQTQRGNAHCRPNGIIGLDFDGIPLDELESAKQTIAEVAYVFAVCLSVSGNGLFALAAYEGTPNLKNLLTAMQADFPYEIDKSCSDVSRLRFVTWDENLIVKDEVFPAILTKQKEAVINVDGTSPLESSQFPVDCLPQVLRDMVIEGALSLHIDRVYFATLILPIVASVIGARYVLVAKEDWFLPSILWTVLVAQSGGGKSPTLEALLKPLETLDTIAGESYERAMQEFFQEQAIHESKMMAWRAAHKKYLALPSHEQNREPEPPMPPREPTRKQYIMDDTTTEALFVALSENEDGVAMAHDELDGWVGNFDAHRTGGNKDESVYNRAFDGRPARINRKSGDKKVLKVKNTHTSITGCIPLLSLREMVSKKPRFLYSGLFARLLLVMPPDEKRKFTKLSIPESVKTAYYSLFDTIIAWREYENIMSPDKPYRVKMTVEAEEAFIENYDALEAERVSPHTPEVLKSTLSKMQGVTGRIALVLHIAEYASQSPDGTFPGTIPPLEKKTMDNAVRIARWFIGQTRRVLQFICPHEMEFSDNRIATAILNVIHEKGKTTKAELHRLQVFKDTPNAATVMDAELLDLKKRGVIESTFVKNDKGGRGKEVYRLAGSEK